MLASSWIEIDGKDWARLKEVCFGDTVALAPILPTAQQHDDQSVIAPPITSRDSLPGPGQMKQAGADEAKEERTERQVCTGASVRSAPSSTIVTVSVAILSF